MTNAATKTPNSEALAERLLAAALGMADLHMVYLGERLGLYQALADGAGTAGEVARATDTDERYVREWLEQQAVTGMLDVDEPRASPHSRIYRLSPAGHEVLVDKTSPYCMTPLARMMVGIVRPLPQVLDAFRAGHGVSYAQYDSDFCEGQGDMNGVMFDTLLSDEWLPALPDVSERLGAEPPARIADIGCGTGRSTLAIARAYTKVKIIGIDADEHSVDVARRELDQSPELADRVAFCLGDAARLPPGDDFDLVTIFEAVHDLADPIAVLAAVRERLSVAGTVLIADERVAEHFTAPGDRIERLMYGYSVLHCLPVGMFDQPSAQTGTVMRPDTLRAYALAAGFASIEVAPIEHEFWRFYRLLQ